MTWKDILKAKKPDFIDLDGDGNTTEPMSEAAKDVEKQGYKDDTEELRERGLISGYDAKDVIEWEKGYEDRQIKRMLTTIREWAKKFDWNKADIEDPIRFRQNRRMKLKVKPNQRLK